MAQVVSQVVLLVAHAVGNVAHMVLEVALVVAHVVTQM